MSVAVVTAYDKNWVELGALTSRFQRDYAMRHGYHFIEYVGDPGEYHPSWMKLEAIRMGLDVADTVFWSDADAIIVNPECRLEDRFDSRATLTISEDPEGLNCGVFFVHSPKMSSCNNGGSFLGLLLGWRLNNPEYGMKTPWEQKAVNEMHHEAFVRNKIGVEVVDQRLFNAYDPQYYPFGTYQDGDFMLHYPGYDYNWKWNIINRRLAMLGSVEKRCNRNCKLERKRH